MESDFLRKKFVGIDSLSQRGMTLVFRNIDHLSSNENWGTILTLKGESMEVNSKQERSFDSVPTIIPVVPTLNVTVFPNMIMPLLVLDERIINGIKRAVETEGQILLLSARSGGQDGQEIDTDNLYSLGTVATIMRVIEIPQEGIKVLV